MLQFLSSVLWGRRPARSQNCAHEKRTLTDTSLISKSRRLMIRVWRTRALVCVLLGHRPLANRVAASFTLSLSLSFIAKKDCINTYIYTYVYIYSIHIQIYICTCAYAHCLRCSAYAHKTSCSSGKKQSNWETSDSSRRKLPRKRRLGSFVRPLRVCNSVPFCCFFSSIFFHITMYRNDKRISNTNRQVRTLLCCIMVWVF